MRIPQDSGQVPGLMKHWLDEVFVHGFAHGSAAKLGGKKLINGGATGTLYR